MAYMENAKFEDIQKGDRVRVAWVFRGATRSIEGIAHEESNGDWTTVEGSYLNTVSVNESAGMLTILERHEPVFEDQALLLDRDGDAWQYDSGAGVWWCVGPVAGNLSYTNLVGTYGPVKHTNKENI